LGAFCAAFRARPVPRDLGAECGRKLAKTLKNNLIS